MKPDRPTSTTHASALPKDWYAVWPYALPAITWLATGAVQCSVWWDLLNLGCCGANAIAVEAARWNADTHARMDTQTQANHMNHIQKLTDGHWHKNTHSFVYKNRDKREWGKELENKCKGSNEKRVCIIHKCIRMIEWMHACLSSHTCLHVHEWVEIVYVCLYVLVYPEVCVHQEHFISP